jgi:putative transposase
MMQTRIGKLHLQVPKTRELSFYPTCLEKGTRSERALGLAMAEMYVNGVSTRVKKITEELCGLEVSSTQVSRLNQLLDEESERFRCRPLGKMIYVYLVDPEKLTYSLLKFLEIKRFSRLKSARN